MLRSIEHRIESLFEGVFGRAFRSNVQPVELARKLAKEMDEHRTVSVSRIYVPNEYHLYLSPKDRELFRGYEQGLLTELADYLADHARREGYALVSRPRVELHEDADLSVGEFGIATRLGQEQAEPQADVLPPTAVRPIMTPPPPVVIPPIAPTPPLPPAEPDGVPLEAGGTRAYEVAALSQQEEPPAPALEPARGVIVYAGVRHEVEHPVLTVGRGRDCDITIDDPSVSRRHAELRREAAGYTIVDLGSTNGTQLNGAKIDQAALADGDRITVGQTELRFERA
jgi:hypothetical protein